MVTMLTSQRLVFVLLTACLCVSQAWAVGLSITDSEQRDHAQGQVPPNSQQLSNYLDLNEAAGLALQEGRLNEAIKLLRQALTQTPEESLANVQNNLSVAYVKRGNYRVKQPLLANDALEDFQYALFYMLANDRLKTDPVVHQQNKQATLALYRKQFLAVHGVDNLIYHLQQGRQAREEGNFEVAIVEFHQALSKDAKNYEAALGLGDMYSNLNRFAEAIAHMNTAYRYAPTEEKAPIRVKLANAYYSSGQHTACLKLLNEAHAQSPKDDSILALLQHFWEAKLNQSANDVVAMVNLGTVLQTRGALLTNQETRVQAHESAFRLYQQAYTLLKAQPELASESMTTHVLFNVVSLYLENNQPGDALETLAPVLAQTPPPAQALGYALQAGILKEQPQPAIAQWQAYCQQATCGNDDVDLLLEAVEQSKITAFQKKQLKLRLSEALLNVGVLQGKITAEFLTQYAPQETLTIAQRWTQAEPNNITAWLTVGDLAKQLQEVELSQTAYYQANTLSKQQLTPTPAMAKATPAKPAVATNVVPVASIESQLEKAYALISSQHYSDALPLVGNIIKQSPKEATAWYYQALCHEQLGKLALAKQQYVQAIALDKTYVEAYYGAGVASLKLKEPTETIAGYFKSFVNLMNTLPSAKQSELEPQRAFALKQLNKAVALVSAKQ